MQNVSNIPYNADHTDCMSWHNKEVVTVSFLKEKNKQLPPGTLHEIDKQPFYCNEIFLNVY